MWISSYDTSGLAPTTEPQSDVYNSSNQMRGDSYDASGNQLVVTGDTLTYDAENRQTSAYDSTSQTTINYLYDGNNQRVEASVQGGAATVFVYDAGGQLISQYSSGTAVTPDCQTCYLSYDHLGSLRLVTDETMALVARHDYLPFGEEVQGGTAGRGTEWDPQDNIPQKFTGQLRDVTGLDFFKARYFSSTQGRFNSVDPHNAGARRRHPQSWNGYSYVWNNPLRFTDPKGLLLYAYDGDGDDDDGDDNDSGGGGGGGGDTYTPDPGAGDDGSCEAAVAGTGLTCRGDGAPGPGDPGEGQGEPDQGDGNGSTGSGGSASGGFYYSPWTGQDSSASGAPKGASPAAAKCPECPSGWGVNQRMLVTGYDNSFQSTGKNPGDPGYGITKSGEDGAAWDRRGTTDIPVRHTDLCSGLRVRYRYGQRWRNPWVPYRRVVLNDQASLGLGG